MSEYCKSSKTERLRKRLFYQFNKADYTGAARLGEALLRAHIRFNTMDADVYDEDVYNTALACDAAGHVNRAIELYTESIRRSVLKSGISITTAERLTNLAALLSGHSQHKEACSLFVQALTIYKQNLPHTCNELANALFNTGSAFLRAGRSADAIPVFENALHIYLRNETPDTDKTHADIDKNETGDVVNCLLAIAKAHETEGNCESAIPYAEAAWHALAVIDISEHHRTGHYLAGLYDETGRGEDACKLYMSVMAWIEDTAGNTNTCYINLAAKTASRLAGLGQLQQSKEILMRLCAIVKNTVGEDNLTYTNCIRNLAVLHRQLEEWSEAEELIRETESIFKNFPEANPPEP